MRGHGAIPVIEAAYNLAASDDEWLGELGRRACATLGDPEYPAYSAIFQNHEQGFDVLQRSISPHREDWLTAIDRIEAMVPRRVNRRKYAKTDCSSASELARRVGAPSVIAGALFSRTFPRDLPFSDVVQLIGCGGDLISVGVTAPVRKPITLNSRVKSTWLRVSAHMLAGYRLRAAARGGQDRGPLDRADLVLETDGKVAHARGDAMERTVLESLRVAARSVDTARGSLSHDSPEKAVELWQGLFVGKWSIAETFDTDGRAYVVAMKNDPQVAEDRALTRRERQVVELASTGMTDDLIGYSLGISSSTAQTHLHRAIIKIGVRSRIGLIRSLRMIMTKPNEP